MAIYIDETEDYKKPLIENTVQFFNTTPQPKPEIKIFTTLGPGSFSTGFTIGNQTFYVCEYESDEDSTGEEEALFFAKQLAAAFKKIGIVTTFSRKNKFS